MYMYENERNELEFRRSENSNVITKIKVLGIGGAGCNAVNRMIADGISNVEFIAVNTDLQVLNNSMAKTKLQIGKKLTRGLGAGSRPDIGEKAAQEDIEEIKSVIGTSDMVFITAGMGGGTGTGAAPIFAKLAKDVGALTVAVVTLPFDFEGNRKIEIAQEGIAKLKEQVDTMLVISNSKIKDVTERKIPFKDAFRKLDDVLIQAVQGISDIITMTGFINVDFADVKTVLSNSGEAIMGIGVAHGDNRARDATQAALDNPLIRNSAFKNGGAGSMLANLIVGSDFAMSEYDEAGNILREYCRGDASVIKIGVSIDETMKDRVKIVVLATGFGEAREALEPEKPIPAEEIFEERKVVSLMDMKQEKNRFRVFTSAQQSDPKKTHATEEVDYEVPAYLRKKKKMG